MIKKDFTTMKVNRTSYEQYLNGYEQYKIDRDYQQLTKLYEEATSEVEKKALKRALYAMEVE